uniref:Pyridoxal-dependent decarboxylase domain-containing protein 1 n=1 Tax=Wuchereria bancrofti TaxID=6293 RepID=A0A1I8EQZ7_WUCBA
MQIDLMMATSSEAEATMNAARQIINNIEKFFSSFHFLRINILNNLRYRHSLAIGMHSNGSLLNANNNNVVERSVLERLASNPGGNDSDNAEKLERGTRAEPSTNVTTSRILQQLEQLIRSDDWVNKEVKDYGESPHPSEFPKKRGYIVSSHLSELGRTLIVSSSLKSYINLLGTHHRQCIASWLYGSTSQTLSTLFRTSNSNLHCSEHDSSFSNSIKTEIGHAIRLALYDAYGPDYCSKGWRAFLQMGSPVVYISPALHIDLSSYLSTEYLIGDIVILKKSDGDFADIEGRIDHIAFEKQLDDDIAAGKKPLVVIGVVGSSILGQNDIISRLLEIRKSKAEFWIHVVGQGLAALCLKEPSETLVHVLSQVDSFTAPLALWLGIPAAPIITLYRSVDNQKPLYHEKLAVLPWWVAYHHFTPSKITDTIENAYFLSKVMLRGLAAFPQIEILGVENPIEFANRVYKSICTSPTVLIFKYRCPNLVLEQIKKEIPRCNSRSSSNTLTNDCVYSGDANNAFVDDSSPTSDNDIDKLEYADSLNFWVLSQGLISDCSELGLQMKLSDALAIIESTITAKKRFKEIVSKYPSLGLAPVRKWAGVGAVCYVPSIVKETPMNEWNKKQRQQVSHLNLDLVHSLRSVDTAFSAGESPAYSISCVKFGMLSNDKDLTDLVHLVAERGREIEQSQKYMDSLAEMIRQGIEAANKDLKRENDERLIQEGMMRQIPLMSSLVNWFSPLDKDFQGIKGRSFDLKTGQIQSTEVYYKHRFMNRSDATSQNPHNPVVKTSNESTKQNVNLSGDTIQRDIALGNETDNDIGSSGLINFLFHFLRFHFFSVKNSITFPS